MSSDQFLTQLIMVYGYTIYYISYVFYKLCNITMKYYPDNAVPLPRSCCSSFSISNNNEKIDIKNIQYASSLPRSTLIDITQKGNILIKLLWNNKIKYMKNQEIAYSGGFILNDFIKFIGNCVVIYIDYQIQTVKSHNVTSNKLQKNSVRRVKKIIDLSNKNYPIYLDANLNKCPDFKYKRPSNIPVSGEIIFD